MLKFKVDAAFTFVSDKTRNEFIRYLTGGRIRSASHIVVKRNTVTCKLRPDAYFEALQHVSGRILYGVVHVEDFSADPYEWKADEMGLVLTKGEKK